MPTNRPFFANFLAAFRAHSSSTYKASPSPSSPGSTGSSSLSATAHVTTTTSSATVSTSNPRSIATKANAQNPINPASSPPPTSATAAAVAAAAAAAAASSHLHSHSRSPGVSSPIGLGGGISGMGSPGATTPRGRQRRGSDSSNSSGGFRDALGPEKWYIGGRTAGGEERFYRLGMVTAPGAGGGRRVRSLDRLSL